MTGWLSRGARNSFSQGYDFKHHNGYRYDLKIRSLGEKNIEKKWEKKNHGKIKVTDFLGQQNSGGKGLYTKYSKCF